MEGIHTVPFLSLAAKMVLYHKVRSTVGLQSQGIPQVIMFSVPHQQPLSGSVFPPESILVLIQGIHTMVAVDVHKQEFHTFRQHGIPVAHGDTVDVRHHGSLHGKLFLPAVKPLPVDGAVHQVGEVQIVGRQSDLPLSCQGCERFLFRLGSSFEKLLHAEQRLAVPAKIGVFLLFHHGQHRADIVNLGVDHPLL